MQWLDLIVWTEAAGEALSASLNCLYFGRFVASTQTARRVGAFTLVLVNAALGLEALTFLALPAFDEGMRLIALLGVRTTLCTAAALMSLLVWRHSRRRRW